MADSSISDTNNYYSKGNVNETNGTYQNNNTYNYNTSNQMGLNTSYNYQQNVSNEFVGGYNQYNSQTNDPSSTINYQQTYTSGQYLGYQMPLNQGTYNVSTQYHGYTINPGYSQTYSNQNISLQVQGYNYNDVQSNYSNYDLNQVNSQNLYSKTDDKFDNNHHIDDNISMEHSNTIEDNSLIDNLKHNENSTKYINKPKPHDSDSSSRSYSSRDSYNKYKKNRKRSRSRSRSHDRRHHRRSRDHRYKSRSRDRSRSRRKRSKSYERKRSSHKRRHRSRSRSRDRDRDRSRDRSRSRDSYLRKERERERYKSQDRINDKNKNIEYNKEKNKENVMMDVLEKAQILRSNEMERRRLKDIEEAQRDDLTILVANMNLSADEKDIYELFSEHAGKVRDIQLVRDSRSGRSKGIAYVEFYTQEAVIKALSLTGMPLKGQGIRVQSSQAEKNRAARAAKQLQDSALKESDNPTTILVSNLVGVLSNLGETDLQQLFAPFGNIVDVAVARNDLGQTKGYAYIKFKKWNEAKEALNVMNGFDVSGQQLKVVYATTKKDSKSRLHSLGDLDIERIDDDDAGLISGSSNKIALMKKLQERQPVNSSNLVLSNMYSEQDYEDNQEFFDEIEDDVKEECSKHGPIIQVYLNRKKPDGKVYVKFRNYNDAQNAHKSLQGRYFAGNTIQVNFISDEQYLSLTNK